MSASEALNYPLILANADYCTHGEATGTVELFSESDAELFRAAKAL